MVIHKFVLNNMVNDVACNDILHSVSIMAACNFCKKAYSVQTGWHYIVSYMRYITFVRGARWLSGRVSDSGARGPGFETYLRRVVSLSKTLYSPKVLVNYPGSDGSVPT